MVLFGGKSGIVKIELVDYCVNVKGCLYWIELELGVWYVCVVGYYCVWYDWFK